MRAAEGVREKAERNPFYEGRQRYGRKTGQDGAWAAGRHSAHDRAGSLLHGHFQPDSGSAGRAYPRQQGDFEGTYGAVCGACRGIGRQPRKDGRATGIAGQSDEITYFLLKKKVSKENFTKLTSFEKESKQRKLPETYFF